MFASDLQVAAKVTKFQQPIGVATRSWCFNKTLTVYTIEENLQYLMDSAQWYGVKDSSLSLRHMSLAALEFNERLTQLSHLVWLNSVYC